MLVDSTISCTIQVRVKYRSEQMSLRALLVASRRSRSLRNECINEPIGTSGDGRIDSYGRFSAVFESPPKTAPSALGDRLTDASKLPSNGLSYLPKDLPRREGPAPHIMPRTLPQRQYPAPLANDIYNGLHSLPSKNAKKYPELLTLDKSVTEGSSTDAIYARPELPGRKKATQDKVLGNEIAHVHPAENSVHVWLTQTDARKVVEAGWGLRFPLASLGICDEGWTFVYAPRTMEEVDVAEEIVRACIGHLTGEKVSG